MLYISIGAPCNVCDKQGYARIIRMRADGSERESFAEGIRNSVGFAWHPETGELWFTDNGRDMLGDDIPPDELNHANRQGQHFGYPYCHAGDIPGDFCAPFGSFVHVPCHFVCRHLLFFHGTGNGILEIVD